MLVKRKNPQHDFPIYLPTGPYCSYADQGHAQPLCGFSKVPR